MQAPAMAATSTPQNAAARTGGWTQDCVARTAKAATTANIRRKNPKKPAASMPAETVLDHPVDAAARPRFATTSPAPRAADAAPDPPSTITPTTTNTAEAGIADRRAALV